MKPMEGIKVIELSTMLAGPMTARILAEWGAEAVSYTHLDVYKRQIMNSGPPIFTKSLNV